MAKKLKVLKFGGTSMGSAAAIEQVISIIQRPSKYARVAAVVVSAMSGVTDQLIKIAHLAAERDNSYKNILKQLEKRHVGTVKALIKKSNQRAALAEIEDLFTNLRGTARGFALIRDLSPAALDYIMSYGERLSGHVLTAALKDKGVAANYLNARKLITTDENFGEAAVDFAETNRKIRRYFKEHRTLQIVTGFIGATRHKKTTTLGRGGSDYSASIIGAALGASRIEIWTDVSGVFTANPQQVEAALPVASMTYSEAMEMSYFGAKVIHPPTMRPAQEKNIPIVIKNTFEPEAPGTVIQRRVREDGRIAKGISSISDVTMLLAEGDVLQKGRGASGRIFGALARARVNVVLITQASSQHSVSFAVYPRDVDRACAAIEEEFALERSAHLLDPVTLRRELSIIAVVGEGMREQSGIAGRLFSTLGKNGVNIVAIAQGSSELNISVVVAKADEAKALNAVHTGFFFPETKPINVFLVGTGLIGSTLLEQIREQSEILKKGQGFDIRIAGIANSHTMIFDPAGIDLNAWQRALKRSRTRMNLVKFIDAIKRSELPARVFVDCTASETVAQSYADILAARISVVTPNKRANSGSYEYFKKLSELAKVPGITFLYETNACAALPIISMIDDLVLSGDRILKIEGVLSGTMSYIFNQLNSSSPKRFSEAVKEARQLGFTEPDPREDLNGLDVARKILILARKAGFPMELSDVRVESLLSPLASAARSVEDFYTVLEKEDAAFEKKRVAAQRRGKRIRHVATLERGKASVGLRSFAQEHPFYELSASDNIVLITTKRYSKSPLLIQGPGAGGDVTAAGVFADILRVARDAA